MNNIRVSKEYGFKYQIISKKSIRLFPPYPTAMCKMLDKNNYEECYILAVQFDSSWTPIKHRCLVVPINDVKHKEKNDEILNAGYPLDGHRIKDFENVLYPFLTLPEMAGL